MRAQVAKLARREARHGVVGDLGTQVAGLTQRQLEIATDLKAQAAALKAQTHDLHALDLELKVHRRLHEHARREADAWKERTRTFWQRLDWLLTGN